MPDVRAILLRTVPAFMLGLMLSVLVFDRIRATYQSHDTSPTPSEAEVASAEGNRAAQTSYNRYRQPPITLPPQSPASSTTTTTTARIIADRVSLLILIFSEPTAADARSALRRESWISEVRHTNEAAHMFVVGISGLSHNNITRLESENRQNRDMVLLPQSSQKPYNSQLLLAALKWSIEHVSFEFLLKCNDQSYVTVERLLSELPRQPKTGLVWGYFSGNQEVTREGPLAETTWNLCSTYLPYAQGGGYVLSQDVVAMVTDLGPDLDYLTHEDIALGVWLSPFKHIHRVHDVRFNTGPTSRGCRNTYVISHPESIESMAAKHKMAKEKLKICWQEFDLLSPYLYDWATTTSNCCNKTIPLTVNY